MKSYLTFLLSIFLLSLLQATPNASFTASTTSGVFPLAVSFNASASSDSQSGTLQYLWTFGDGNQTSGSGVLGRTSSNTYTSNGTFTVTLTVLNLTTFQSGTTSKTITVNVPTGTYNFPVDATHDAHLKNGTSTNDGNFLKTGAGYVAYLKYNIPSLPGNITGAKLQLTYSFMGGQNGAVAVAKGSNTNWTETNLTNSNRPSSGTNYGNINTNTSTFVYTKTITLSDITEGGVVNLILTSSNSSAHNFACSEGDFEEERPKLILTVNNSPCNYQSLNGRALDIGAGGGSTFVVGTNRRVYKRNGNGWSVYPAGPLADRIDVDGNGRPWITATDRKIYRWTGSAWQLLSGRALDIGCNGNDTYVIGTNNRIYRFNGSSWSVLSTGRALKIDVASDGNPWVVGTNHRIYQYQGGRWLVKGSLQARDISVRKTAANVFQVWTLERNSGNAYYYQGGGQYQSFGGVAEHITVGNDGTIWVVNGGKRIYKKKCSTMPASPSIEEKNELSEVELEDRSEQMNRLKDNPLSTIRLYPNPTSSNLNVAGIEGERVTIELFNNVGALVRRYQGTDNVETNLDVSSLSAGMYVLVVHQEGKQQILKFVKE